MKSVKLFSFFKSSASWRVRIALNLKKIEYDYIPVNILKSEGERQEGYANINPLERVPSLIVDGNVLIESMPIIEFLDEVKPSPRLFPEDPFKKAQVRAVCEIINAGIQPLGNVAVLKQVKKQGGNPDEWLKYWMTFGVRKLERHLEGFSGTNCFGNELTAADLYIYPQLDASINRVGINIHEYPNLARIFQHLNGLDAFIKARPEHQPDYQP